MTFYDQSNDAGDKMIWAWVLEQFDSTDGSKAAKFKPFEVEIKMKNLSAPGAADKVYKLKNAYIVDAQHDTLDYSTSDPVMWSLTIRYEDLEAPGFTGSTPTAPAHIKPLPKPPEPVKPADRKKTQSSSFTPITKPPKADAKVEAEPSKWVQAGGTETGGGAATGNPSMTSQARRARENQANRANQAPRKEISWPSWVPFVGRKTTNGNLTNNTEGTVTPVTSTTDYNTNTGTDKTSSPTRPPVTSPATANYLNNQQKAIDQSGFNPEYKKAYMEALRNDPPISDSARAIQTAEQRARLKALQVAPQYPSQARTVDNGVKVDKNKANNTEPYAPPARVGNTNANANVNDRKGDTIVNRQTTLENNVRAAQNVNDSIAAERAYKAGRLTPAQVTEYQKTGKVTGIKGAPGYNPNEKSDF
jgi:hypothetical protein